MRTWITAATLLVALAAPRAARADAESTALVVDATQIMPRDGVHAGATGVGAELRFLPDRECMTASIGGFAAIGAQGTDLRRDVVDVHVQFGFRPRKAGISPYVGLGLDVLHITTHTDDRSFRGTTLGLSAQVGVIGKVSDRIVLRATASYLGAIVPGTGDDLGGVVLQAGLGFTIDD